MKVVLNQYHGNIGRLKLLAKNAPRFFGHDLVGVGGFRPSTYRLLRTPLPKEFRSARRTHLRQPLTIPLDKVVNVIGFGLGPNSWHPYVAALQQWVNTAGDLTYDDSVLCHYFDCFQPTSVSSVWRKCRTHPIRTLEGLPVNPLIFKNVWALNGPALSSLLAHIEAALVTWESQYTGPLPRRVGERHFLRLLETYQSIAGSGYRPHDFQQGYVSGYFLIRGKDWRFVALQGQHRLAALSVLGQQWVKVFLATDQPAGVSRSHLEPWVDSSKSLYTLQEAERIFDSIYEGWHVQRTARTLAFS